MRIEADWLARPETQAVLSMLEGAGHAALVVGGAVRNAVMDLPAKDVDIATDARPDQVLDLCETVGLKAVPTGIAHGTVTVIAGGLPYEVTTFRRDVETDGRRAVVAFSDRIEDDARRRDFTMNALYARADGTLVDPLGGLDDARAGRVRFIEDPVQRIREDFLRILRFFRFHAWYGRDGIDAEGLAACAAEVEGLDCLSRERIGSETLRLLSAPDPAPAVAALAATGGLGRILPGTDHRALPVLVHLERTLDLAPSALRRLSVLGGPDPATALRLSNADARHLSQVRSAIETGLTTDETAYRHGASVAIDAALVVAASAGSPVEPDLADRAGRSAAQTFPVRAADLMPGFTGPALGARLAQLERRWIASGFRLSRDDLLGGD